MPPTCHPQCRPHAAPAAPTHATVPPRLSPAARCSWPWPLLVGAMVLGVSVGPADIPLPTVLEALLGHVPLLHYHPHVSALDWDVIWQIRLPRVVLGGLVGAMLAGGGAAYQGVFRNPLADPYLLGRGGGAGLGATLVIVDARGAIQPRSCPSPPSSGRSGRWS